VPIDEDGLAGAPEASTSSVGKEAKGSASPLWGGQPVIFVQQMMTHLKRIERSSGWVFFALIKNIYFGIGLDILE
jgi:hypothetical protein